MTSGGRGVADEIIRYFKTFCRRLSETSAHRCLFETSDSRYPAQDLQTYLKKNAKKSTSFRVFSLPTFYRVSRLPTSFRVPPADLLEIFIFLLTSFRDLHLPTTFRDFCLPTTLSGPSHVLLEKLQKNRRLPEIFRYFRLPTTFSRFPPADDFHRTFQHL